jgi:hypothetical protein
MMNALADLADIVDVVKIAFLNLQLGTTRAFASMAGGLGMFSTFSARWAQELNRTAAEEAKAISKLEAGPSSGDKIRKAFLDARLAADEAAKTAMESKKAPQAIGDEFINVSAKIREVTKDLKEQNATILLSAGAAAEMKLKMMGATDEQLKEVHALGLVHDALEKQKKANEDLESKRKGIFEATRTPMEKFKQQVADLNQMFVRGMIDQETYLRSYGKGLQEAKGEKKYAGLAEMGSKEAYSAILQYTGKDTQEQGIRDIAKTALDQLKVQRDTLAVLKNPSATGATTPVVFSFPA